MLCVEEERRMTVDEELDEFATVNKWLEWCMNCKHAYRRIDDADTLYCRLRKRKCPHVAEMAERKDE